jgi:hypothetical protein
VGVSEKEVEVGDGASTSAFKTLKGYDDITAEMGWIAR